MKQEIFISYSRSDLQVVQAIRAEIEATGASCWMDLSDIRSGEDYLNRIVEGIQNCRVFLFMLSKHSQESEHAIGELIAAKKHSQKTGSHVVIVNIDDCDMNLKFTVRFSTLDNILWSNPMQRQKLMADLEVWSGAAARKANEEEQRRQRRINELLDSIKDKEAWIDKMKQMILALEKQLQARKDEMLIGEKSLRLLRLELESLRNPETVTAAMAKVESAAQFVASAARRIGPYLQKKAEEEELSGMSAADMSHLGDDYYCGRNGKSKDMAEAAKWYRRAAERGYPHAQYNLGCFYRAGTGVPKDTAEGMKWYRKAADQGFAHGQCNLGVCYYDGDGVPQDYTEAMKWFHLAAAQGHAGAQCNLGACYEHGNGVPQDYTEAAKWYSKAAEQGHARAQYNIGTCYYTGQGVPQDYAEAAKWYRKAAAQGHANAKKWLKKLEEKGY